MMNYNVNHIVLNASNYHTTEDFCKAISNVLTVLFDNGYTVNVKYDGLNIGVVVIEYRESVTFF